MMYHCHICGANFDAPAQRKETEDMNGEGAFETRYIDICPECGAETIEEVHDEE